MTVVSTLADSYLHASSHFAGGAAEIASVRKESKYSLLPPDYILPTGRIRDARLIELFWIRLFLCEVGRVVLAEPLSF